MRSGLLAGIKWSVCMLKSHSSLCESFSRTVAGLCIYHLLIWSNWTLRIFHTIVSWWSFAGVWVTANFIRRPRLSILADLNNDVARLVSVRTLIPNSFYPFTKSLRIVPSAPNTISITVTFMFHSLFVFSSLEGSMHLSLFSFPLIFTHRSAGTANSPILQVHFFFIFFLNHHEV